ncbi:unnamed protein product [Durusdinium trenchii]|uniref:Tubulin-tyrosine ligase n=1 Tax=Durusdinium trenchii TaxID=1381693 RepID=A0ABP0R9G5_9DINO
MAELLGGAQLEKHLTEALPPTGLQLIAARRGAPAGSVQDLHRKHLLALVARQDELSVEYLPRSYLLPPDRGPTMSEWESFQRDFTLCDCLACLKTCCETARKSPDLEGATWKLQEASYHALESLKSFNLPGLVQSVEAIETIEDAEALVKAFEEAMPSLQPKILRRNWWLLKPVDGAVGKGIGLLGGLGSNMPQIAPEMFKGRASDGYILQKYVEMPHLLDPSLLQEAEQAELAWQPTTSSAAAPRVVREGTPPAMFKYNLRHWVLINWTGSDPPVWFYEHGYIELCTTPFTESLEVGSHIANLSQQGKPTLSAPCKRMWSTSTLSRYLEAVTGKDLWTTQILPEIKQVVARIVAAACPLRTGTEDGVEEKKQRHPWRRFGFDFALDEHFKVWLIEVNHRPGMKCAKGWQGDAKRRLLAQFYPDEQLLCGPNYGMSGDTWDPIGAFQRLPQQ